MWSNHIKTIPNCIRRDSTKIFSSGSPSSTMNSHHLYRRLSPSPRKSLVILTTSSSSRSWVNLDEDTFPSLQCPSALRPLSYTTNTPRKEWLECFLGTCSRSNEFHHRPPPVTSPLLLPKIKTKNDALQPRQVLIVKKRFLPNLPFLSSLCWTWVEVTLSEITGSCHKRQKPLAPIRNLQTRKVANAKGNLNRNTYLT